MSQAVRNQTIPQTSSNEDYAYEQYSEFEMEEAPDFQDQYLGMRDGDPLVPMSARELRGRISQLTSQLEASALSLSDSKLISARIASLKSQIDTAQGLSSNQREKKMSEIQVQLGELESKIIGIPEDELSGGWGDSPENNPEEQSQVSTEQIQDLLGMLKKDERAPTEAAKLNKDQCIQLLNDATEDQKNGRVQAAGTEFAQVLEALGGEMDDKEVAADILGETPAKIEGDTFYFNGTENPSLHLKSPDTGKEIVIDEVEQVFLSPKNSAAEVSLSEEAGYYVVKMGSDTFKVSKSADLQINSEHVSGDLDNAKGKITVGTSDATYRKFTNPKKLTEMGGKISAALAQMDHGQFVRVHSDYPHGVVGGPSEFAPLYHDEKPDTKYGVIDSSNLGIETVEDAKKVISSVAAALKEMDPEKKKEAWDQAVQVLSLVESQTSNPGYTNDKAQLIFDVLYGELGEKDFKSALSSGLIPQDFSNQLVTGLEANPNENCDLTGEITEYQVGGPGWTHQSSSDFLKKNNGSKAPSSV